MYHLHITIRFYNGINARIRNKKSKEIQAPIQMDKATILQYYNEFLIIL